MSELVVEAVLAEQPAQLDVVVDLAVVGDPVAAAVGHRLVAGLEVDDRQAPVRERRHAVVVHPGRLAVRAAVAQEVVHQLDRSLGVSQRAEREADGSPYTAHGATGYAAALLGPCKSVASILRPL